MAVPPRDPRSKLLDADGLRFVVVAGAFKALIAGLLLVFLPRHGYSLEATRTVVFLYATIGQLVYAYPARRLHGSPSSNLVLHASVVLGIGVQLLTVLVPWLRALLGLEALDAIGFLVLGVAILTSWGAVEAFTWGLGSRRGAAA